MAARTERWQRGDRAREELEKAHLSEIEAIPVPETLEWTPVRRHFGIQAFGVNAYTAAEVGKEVVERHTEDVRKHEELYVVVIGRASFTLDGEEVEAPVGTAIFIREPSVERYAVALEPGTTVLAMGGKPGTAYTPGPWEWVFVARSLGEAGDFDAAIAELEEGLNVHPGHPALLYRLANWEARAGRTGRRSRAPDRGRGTADALREPAQTDEAFASDPRRSPFPAAS